MTGIPIAHMPGSNGQPDLTPDARATVDELMAQARREGRAEASKMWPVAHWEGYQQGWHEAMDALRGELRAAGLAGNREAEHLLAELLA